MAQTSYGHACYGLWRERILRSVLFLIPALFAVMLWASAGAAYGADATAPPSVRAEVDALLSGLETTGCRFRRNGSWHTGAEARSHLTRKWLEMERRQMALTTEQFIEKGASSSMLTGDPYLVQCGSAAAQPSRIWLMERLQAERLQAERLQAERLRAERLQAERLQAQREPPAR